MGENLRLDDKNYATDEELSNRAMDFMRKVTIELRANRSNLDEQYLRYYNIFRCISDVRFYNGETQVYFPVLRKAIEQFVSRVKQALFPTDDVFDVEPVDVDMQDESNTIRDFMKWQIDKRVKLRSKIDKFLRQLAIYGWVVVECGWEEEVKQFLGLQKKLVPVTEKVYDPLTDREYEEPTGEVETVIEEVVKEVVKKRNPTFVVEDTLATYLWPYTANDIDEVYGVVTLTKQTKGYLLKKEKAGWYENVSKLNGLSGDRDDTFQWTINERLGVDGLDDEQTKIIPRYTLLKYKGLFNWGTEEKPDEQETIITCIGGEICLELRKNPYYDQDKPYLLCRLVELVNEVYSDGLIAPLASLSYYLNDIGSQVFDSNFYTLNPIIKYNPGAVVNINSITFSPGAMWAVNDPTAVDVVKFQDVAQSGFNIMGNVKGLIEEYPGLQNIPMTGRKAALHISALQQEFSLPVQQVVENIEDTVLSPWLKKAYCRNQQFLDKSEVYKVMGKDGVRYWREVSPENLVGDYNFYWRGANQSVNLHVKSQQISQFLATAAPFIPLLLQRQTTLGIDWILKRYWSEGLGMDGAEKAIESLANEKVIPPDVENLLLALGKPIPTSKADNPEEHIQIHQGLLQSENPEVVEIAKQHIEQHEKDLQMLQQLMEQQITATTPQGEESLPGEQELEGEQLAPNLGGRT